MSTAVHQHNGMSSQPTMPSQCTDWSWDFNRPEHPECGPLCGTLCVPLGSCFSEWEGASMANAAVPAAV